jgi:hypothetical protein
MIIIDIILNNTVLEQGAVWEGELGGELST